jgi:hypothetical protein
MPCGYEGKTEVPPWTHCRSFLPGGGHRPKRELHWRSTTVPMPTCPFNAKLTNDNRCAYSCTATGEFTWAITRVSSQNLATARVDRQVHKNVAYLVLCVPFGQHHSKACLLLKLVLFKIIFIIQPSCIFSNLYCAILGWEMFGAYDHPIRLGNWYNLLALFAAGSRPYA